MTGAYLAAKLVRMLRTATDEYGESVDGLG
jgi:hypothetical protein